MNKVTKIILVIMSTFYMNGCSTSNDDATNYFETRFGMVSRVIDFDNDFQEKMSEILGVETADSLYDSLSEAEFEVSVTQIEKVYHQFTEIVDSSKRAAHNLNFKEDDKQLNRATIAVLEAYAYVLENEYKAMIDILKKPYVEISDDDEKVFNQIYEQASKSLNGKINLFYDASDDFCECNNIKLDWE